MGGVPQATQKTLLRCCALEGDHLLQPSVWKKAGITEQEDYSDRPGQTSWLPLLRGPMTLGKCLLSACKMEAVILPWVHTCLQEHAGQCWAEPGWFRLPLCRPGLRGVPQAGETASCTAQTRPQACHVGQEHQDASAYASKMELNGPQNLLFLVLISQTTKSSSEPCSGFPRSLRK